MHIEQALFLLPKLCWIHWCYHCKPVK